MTYAARRCVKRFSNNSVTFKRLTFLGSSDDVHDVSKLLAFIVYGVLLAAIAFIGLALNLASFVVLIQKSMRSSINAYLAGLSFFDGLLLLFSLLIFPAHSYYEYFGGK